MNIKEYKFKYGMTKIVEVCNGGLLIDVPSESTLLHKDDIIAMAKHFQLTADDIKRNNHEHSTRTKNVSTASSYKAGKG